MHLLTRHLGPRQNYGWYKKNSCYGEQLEFSRPVIDAVLGMD